MSSEQLPKEYQRFWYGEYFTATICRTSSFTNQVRKHYEVLIGDDLLPNPFYINRNTFVSLAPEWANYIILTKAGDVIYSNELPPLLAGGSDPFDWWAFSVKGGVSRNARWEIVGAHAQDLSATLIKDTMISWCRERTRVPKDWWKHRRLKELHAST